MVGPDLKWGEHLVRESPEIIIKENLFTLYLTDRRLLFGHATRKNSFWIDLEDLADVEFYETEAGEPLFVISVRSKKKIKPGDKPKQVIMVFSGQSGLPRGDEAEVLFSFIHAIAGKNQRNIEGKSKKKKHLSGGLLPGELQCGCGNKFREGASFCTFCGTKIVQPVKKDQKKFVLFSFGSTKPGGTSIPAGVEPGPAEEKASSVLAPCRICLELIPDNSIFCKYCGAKQVEQKKPKKKSGFNISRFFRAGNNKSRN